MRHIAPALLLLTGGLFIGCAETTEPGEVPITDIQDTAPPADITAPTWPDGAALTISNEQADRLTVQWPPATDDTLVTGYRVSVDGIESVILAGNKSSAVVPWLEFATQYSLSVRAEDAAGNLSVNLEGLGTTADETAPAWATDATLTLGTITETTAVLSWTAATDNVGVAAYRIMDGDAVLMEVAAVSATVTDLDAWTHYTLQVRAVDAAGNVSAGGPKAGFQTTDETAPAFDDGAAIQSTNVTPHSLTLTWPQATDNVSISGYDILRNLVVVATTSGTIRTATVDGLSPGTEYTFRVRASDPAGNHSTTGPALTVNTADTVAPNWPDGAQLVASTITANSLLLAWPPATDDVAVALYEVQQDGVGVASVSTTQALIEGLSPWTEYNFSVRAKDAVGNISKGKLSTSLQTPDTSPPGWKDGDALVVSNLTDTSLTLSWPQATDDVSVTAYKVYQDNVPIADLDALTITLDVSGLSPWTDYTFRVAATDQAGNASTTDLSILQKTADESTPTWPAGLLTVSNTTPYALTLTWTPAADDVAVTQYTITQNGSELETVDGTTTSLDVTDLTAWTDYDFKVEAADAASNWSQNGPSASLTTPDTVDPTWPADATLTVSNLQSTSLELSWPAATDDVGIDHYVITVDGGEAVTVDGELTNATVPGLKAAMTVLIGLRAVDPAGNKSSELTTTQTAPDGGPPTWEDAQLTATAGITEVLLSWTPAVDDVAVTGYRVFQDGEQIAEQQGTELVVSGLGPDTQYAFKVEAGDAADNWSADGPSTTVITAKAFDPGFRRLTKFQYIRTLADLMGQIWVPVQEYKAEQDPADVNDHYTADKLYTYMTTHGDPMLPWRTAYPDDRRVAAPGEHGGFRRLDDAVLLEHIKSWLWMSGNRGTNFCSDGYYYKFGNKTHLEEGGPQQYSEDWYKAAFETFLKRATFYAFRRPVTDEEYAHYLKIWDEVAVEFTDDPYGCYQLGAGLKYGFSSRLFLAMMSTLHVILNAPEFLFQVELGDENGNLTAYELASRLSFHFWNTMPDDELFAAAEDGSLMTEAGYKAQVDRLAAHAQAKETVETFYREFFRVEDMAHIGMQAPHAAQVKYHIGFWNFYGTHMDFAQDAYQTELPNLGTWYTHTAPGTYEEMFRSDLHFLECIWSGNKDGNCYAAGPLSMHIYKFEDEGVCAPESPPAPNKYECKGYGWDGESPPKTLPEPERVGLLTRVSFLGHDSVYARPIRRGLNIREMLLCAPIPPPENCDVVKAPQVTLGMTVREKVESLTEQPGTSCATCHSTFINGFGHALNHFSSRGMYWEKEHMFVTEGVFAGDPYWYLLPEEQWAEIDATGTSILNGQSITVNGAKELTDTLVDSGQLEWCWSRQYFRYALGRLEWDSDADTIEGLAQQMRDGMTLMDAFTAIAFTPQFKSLYKAPKALSEGDQP